MLRSTNKTMSMKKRQQRTRSIPPSSSSSSLSSLSSSSSSSTNSSPSTSSPCCSCDSSPCCSTCDNSSLTINTNPPPPPGVIPILLPPPPLLPPDAAHHHHHHHHLILEEKPKSKRRRRSAKPTNGGDGAVVNHPKSKDDGELTLPLPPPPQGRRSSAFRGVTRHRWTGRFEAHLWDKSSWNNMHNKKGRQVYLGAYDEEEAAARTYDLAALKYWGGGTTLNFPVEGYAKEMEEMSKVSREEYLASLRRRSSGFSRGVSKYRGVARHHHNGRWEARIGRVLGNKYLYLGTFNTQEEAAEAYDMAALEYRGSNAVTNFDVANYVDRLKSKGVQVDQLLQPTADVAAEVATTVAAELDTSAAKLEPSAASSSPLPLPSSSSISSVEFEEEEEEEAAAAAEGEVAMMTMMPPPPEMPAVMNNGNMMANTMDEMLGLEEHDVLSSGWSFCLENAAAAGYCTLPELFDDGAGFQLEDIDYLVFDSYPPPPGDEEGDGVVGSVNDKSFTLSEGAESRSSPCSTTTTVSCN